MSHNLKIAAFSRVAGVCLASLLLNGCGGGGSGGGGTSTPAVPSPLDGTYAVTAVPTATVPADGQAPTSTLVVTNGRANSQFTFYLQKKVVDAVQAVVNKGLTDEGYADEISNNTVPQTIQFNVSSLVDGSGKVLLTQTLTSRANVSLCGSAQLTLDSTLTSNAGSASGQGTYNIQFAPRLTVRVRGRNVDVSGTCNNLPLRVGTVTYAR